MIVAENGVIVHVPGDENLKVPNRISKKPLDALKLLDVTSKVYGDPLIVSSFNTIAPKFVVAPVPLMVWFPTLKK